MKKKWLPKFILRLFLGVFAVLSSAVVGTSTFVYPTKSPAAETMSVTPTEKKPVAFYDSKYFTTVEAAVASANSAGSKTVYVIPGSNPTITSSFTINSGTTLILPYSLSNTTSNSVYLIADTNSSAGGTTAYDSVQGDKCTVSNVYTRSASSCTLTVSVRTGVTITNNGKLYIGGIQSGGGGGYVSGHIQGQHARMVLYGTASIISSGTFVNFGYVVGSSSTGLVTLSGNTYLPFVLIEHRGGSNFIVLDKTDGLKGTPFNRFFYPSFIDVTTKFSTSSKLYAIPDLYAGDQHNRSVVTIIGSGGIVVPGTNFSLENRLSFVTSPATMPKHTLDFYGNCTLGSLSITVSMSIVTENLSTSSVYFPISCYYDLNFHVASGQSSATISSSSQKFKVLPGANVIIDPGVNVSLPGLAVYKKNTASDLTGAAGAISYEVTSADASLVVNGSLSSSILVGYIDTANANASVTCTTTSTTMYEVSSTATATYSLLVKEWTGAICYSFAMDATGPITNALGNRIEGDLPSGTTNASSLGDRWDIELSSHLSSVSFVSSNGSYASGAGAAATFTLTASITPSDADDFDASWGYHWTVGSGGSLSASTGQTVTLSTTANSSTSNNATVDVTVTVRNTSGTEFSGTKTFTRTKGEASCVTPDTLVTMADGSQKPIKYVTQGEMIRIWNHETGQIDIAPVTFNEHDEATMMTVTTLSFSDGTQTEYIYEHGYFDVDLREYVYFTDDNYAEFVGHRFLKVSPAGEPSVVTLTNATQEERWTDCYSLPSYYHLNFFADGFLSMPGGIKGLFNIFELDETFKYDEAKKAADIEKYGLFTREELAALGVDDETYDAYPAAYLKVSIGKGIMTEEDLMYLIERYGKYTQ